VRGLSPATGPPFSSRTFWPLLKNDMPSAATRVPKSKVIRLAENFMFDLLCVCGCCCEAMYKVGFPGNESGGRGVVAQIAGLTRMTFGDWVRRPSSVRLW
jgi:hypothetical protein